MKSLKSSIILAAVIFTCSSTSYASTYKIDLDHSTLGFKIRHLLSYTQGQFNEFDGTLTMTLRSLKVQK